MLSLHKFSQACMRDNALRLPKLGERGAIIGELSEPT